jgi:hypothetical protein
MANERWEFCNLAGTTLIYYPSDGKKRETKVHDHRAAVAQLGDEGWELVAVAPGMGLYFKRPKQ